MTTALSLAGNLLDKSKHIIGVDRANYYGDPWHSFGTIAEMWTAYLRGRGLIAPGVSILRSDVGMLMDLLKTSRHATGGFKEDTFVDKGGYSALSFALAHIEKALEVELSNIDLEPEADAIPTTKQELPPFPAAHPDYHPK
jgi:hypothetical protein